MADKPEKAFKDITIGYTPITIQDNIVCIWIQQPNGEQYNDICLNSSRQTDDLIEALQIARKAKWGDE